jgi:NADPH-dependent 2,4-dienoyl-CoA reductase/sulfur reductase-like enzyme/nitrite reductase/ring-hydroxylating ferredoxin subunit
MSEQPTALAGPDLSLGVADSEVPDDGMLLGHAGGEPVLLVRRGDEIFAIGAVCTHYSGPLAEGLVVGDTVRCPWHHACFDLRTGEALRAPALSPVACWSVEKRDGKIFVREKSLRPPRIRRRPSGEAPGRIVIVGGGAAGFAAAEKLRRLQYQGSLVMLSNDAALPVDRPNLSKDYLAGKAPEDWLPLRPASFYAEQGIELKLGAEVTGIDVRSQVLTLADGGRIPYDRLVLATGAEPVRLTIPGAEQPHVLTLRSFADCQAIIARAASARRAVVLGASFIGLEVAAALRTRGIEVHVVAPEKRPMERILGPQLGGLVRSIHEEHGVIFHLENTATGIDGDRMMLKSGLTLAADLVVAGIGVRPRTALAELAGLRLDRGIVVDACLETSAPGIFAAGDIARWPDPLSGESIRVEHWAVAEQQGQTAALNLLGHRQKHLAVPFFWSQHYDVPINYVGHAEAWDELAVEGDVAAKDGLVRFKRQGRVCAVASVFRDAESLRAEAALEQEAGAISTPAS